MADETKVLSWHEVLLGKWSFLRSCPTTVTPHLTARAICAGRRGGELAVLQRRASYKDCSLALLDDGLSIKLHALLRA